MQLLLAWRLLACIYLPPNLKTFNVQVGFLLGASPRAFKATA